MLYHTQNSTQKCMKDLQSEHVSVLEEKFLYIGLSDEVLDMNPRKNKQIG
jgi:hypothetical protein